MCCSALDPELMATSKVSVLQLVAVFYYVLQCDSVLQCAGPWIDGHFKHKCLVVVSVCCEV